MLLQPVIGIVRRFLPFLYPKPTARGIIADTPTTSPQSAFTSLTFFYPFGLDAPNGGKSSMVNIGRVAREFSRTVTDSEEAILQSNLQDKDNILCLMQMSRLLAMQCDPILERFTKKAISSIDQILTSSKQIILLSQSLPYYQNPFRSLFCQLLSSISPEEEDYIFQRNCPLEFALKDFLEKYKEFEGVLGPHNASVYQMLHLLDAYLTDLTNAVNHTEHPAEEEFLLAGLREHTPQLQASVYDLISHLDYLQATIEQIDLKSRNGNIPVETASVVIRGCTHVRDQLMPAESNQI